MRISPIHAMAHSNPPIAEAFRRLLPEAAPLNLPDDSLAPEPDRDGIALPRFSMSRAAGPVAEATGAALLTTSHSAVRKLHHPPPPAKAA